MSAASLPMFPCPCCGHRTFLQEPPNSWEICPVCFWEDAPDDDHTSNGVTLVEAQDNYALLGACGEKWKSLVRAPLHHESRSADWQSIRDQRKFASSSLLLSIRTTFSQVLRDGGVTLHQMDVLDGYGSNEEFVAAESRDPETRWEDVSDEKLISFGISLVFLDARGYRFYLPAYLCLIARRLALNLAPTGDLCGVWASLRGDSYYATRHYGELREHEKWKVASFLETMRKLGDADECRDARDALKQYWHAYL